MVARIGRNRNTNTVASAPSPITVGNAIAVTLAVADPARLFFEANILPASADVCVLIRLYPAAQDNIARGVWVGRFNFANDTFFRPYWRMPPDNTYTGEISAIILSPAVSEDVYITTY